MNWNEYFYYDESSPSCLRWKVSNGRALKDSVAGTIGGQKYYRVQLKRKVYTVHRIIWEMFNSPIFGDFEVDHIDLDKCNNKILNLRCVSVKENCRNRPLRSDSSSGINNVRRRKITNKRGKLYEAWMGRYMYLDGKRVSKSFSIAAYGEEKAKQLAIEFVNTLKEQDNGLYTDRHGK